MLLSPKNNTLMLVCLCGRLRLAILIANVNNGGSRHYFAFRWVASGVVIARSAHPPRTQGTWRDVTELLWRQRGTAGASVIDLVSAWVNEGRRGEREDEKGVKWRRKEGREGEMEIGREGERERGGQGKWGEGERERGREGERDRGREGEKERWREGERGRGGQGREGEGREW